INHLAGIDQNNLTATVVTGTGTPTVAELVKGGGSAATSTNEQQTVTVPTTATKVRFTFNGVSGSDLTFSAATTPGQVQANLETIAALAGNVSVSSVSNGGPYVVTFQGTLAGVDVLKLSAAVITGTGSVTV